MRLNASDSYCMTCLRGAGESEMAMPFVKNWPLTSWAEAKEEIHKKTKNKIARIGNEALPGGPEYRPKLCGSISRAARRCDWK
jgi:hypothetical protein